MRNAIAWFAAAVLSVGLASASDRERSISEMVSDLQRAQTRMAEGDKAAYATQQDKLKAIGAAILAAKPDTWKDRNETDAAAA